MIQFKMDYKAAENYVRLKFCDGNTL